RASPAAHHARRPWRTAPRRRRPGSSARCQHLAPRRPASPRRARPRRPAAWPGRETGSTHRGALAGPGLTTACQAQPSAGPAPAPQSTYRLQLQPGFGFTDAAGIAGYLAALGVTHAYLSPILQAMPGSAHGYDVVDHSRLSADLGGEGAFRDMVAALRRHGLGVIADIVPNHMAIGAPESLNRQFWSVLRDGPGSAYAHWVDIDWQGQSGRLLLPILAGPLGDCLADLRVDRGGADGTVLRYHEHVLPVRPGTEDLPLAGLADAQHYRLADWRGAAPPPDHRPGASPPPPPSRAGGGGGRRRRAAAA